MLWEEERYGEERKSMAEERENMEEKRRISAKESRR